MDRRHVFSNGSAFGILAPPQPPAASSWPSEQEPQPWALCLILSSISFLDHNVRGWKAMEEQWAEVPPKEEGHGGCSVDDMHEIAMPYSLTSPCQFRKRSCRCSAILSSLCIYVDADINIKQLSPLVDALLLHNSHPRLPTVLSYDTTYVYPLVEVTNESELTVLFLSTDKMRKGVPLTDEDRFPWLEALRDTVGKIMSSSKNVTLTCSALQKKYREILRSADADYKPGQYTSCRVKFICLEAPVEVIADRIRRRSKEGKHFMPVSLLQSQLDLLQIDEAEGVIRVDATMSREAILESILTSHF
ncbi:hypothetical protein B296_00046856 [Ensete ventricosum]|uniref:gluconokinase n=1 Tax=Ensete ventricosum TaxID=4639 RepID=A0A426YJ82_ENSVE|nr:hypothetical protein B296_00046856 [Ensete ventricosum]